jgi:hypothetical protein
MTDRSKFEEMLERLVNEDRDGAEALFHEIVVERSREIYQSILESDDEDLEEADDEDLDESDDEELDESANDDEDLEESDDEDLDESEDEDLDEMFGLDEFEMEADPMGGDATDDMMGDLGMDDEGDMDMGDEGDMDGDVEDRVQDLEDALDDLKAEFEAMMSGDDADDEMDMDMDDEGDESDMDMDDEGDDEESKETFTYEAKKADKKADEKKEKKTAGEQMREYVEKVNGGGLDAAKIGGDNGANAKSTVASKNDMGGTTANILRADTEQGTEANKGALKGSSLSNTSPKDMNTKNMNVPGAKAGKTAFKKTEPGHGAEKKGKPETADKGAHSTIRTTVRGK